MSKNVIRTIFSKTQLKNTGNNETSVLKNEGTFGQTSEKFQAKCMNFAQKAKFNK